MCTIDSTCENTPGSFRCNCKQGFQTADDGHFCKGESRSNLYNILKKGKGSLRKKCVHYLRLFLLSGVAGTVLDFRNFSVQTHNDFI